MLLADDWRAEGVGMVAGPCEDGSRVCVDWGAGKGIVPAFSAGLRHAVLACGFSKGDRVRALALPRLPDLRDISRSCAKINVGDEGVVVGLCNDASVFGNTAPLSLCVDFGAGKGRQSLARGSWMENGEIDPVGRNWIGRWCS